MSKLKKLNRSLQRKQRKAAYQQGREIGEELAKSIAQEGEDPRYAVLVKAHNDFIGIYNKNMDAMRMAMQHLEIRINAIRHVVDDVVAQDLTLLKAGDEGFDPEKKGVHWLAYHTFALQKMKEELEAHKVAAEEATKVMGSALQSPDITPVVMEDVVFGG